MLVLALVVVTAAVVVVGDGAAVDPHAGSDGAPSLHINLTCTSPVQLGFTFECTAQVTGMGHESVTLWPTVNSLQWCAQMTLSPDSPKNISFRCPYPRTGPNAVGVTATIAGAYKEPFPVGKVIPAHLILTESNTVAVDVKERTLRPPAKGSDRITAMQWEPWFTLHNDQWTLAEAVPTLGYYSSFDANVVMQHAMWMVDIGIDYIMVDWTNNLWNINHWSERGVYAQELINATTFTLETYSAMRAAGMSTPDVVLLLGLDNGPAEPLSCLQEEVDWITEEYLPKYRDLMFIYEGKPLLIVFDGGGMYSPTNPLSVGNWTLRLMASQLQTAPGLATRGYWSWMDGVVSPVVVRQPFRTASEVATATCAFFPPGGWFDVKAMGKRQGATLVQEVASLLSRDRSGRGDAPRTVVFNQWNEFAGQAENTTSVYVDIYNATLGNDMEPTSYTECAYRRPNNRRCGGWGFRYLNLLRALIALYTHADTTSTVLAVARPLNHTVVNSTLGGTLPVEWAQVSGVGVDASGCVAKVTLDGALVGMFPATTTKAYVPLGGLPPGEHTLTVTLPECTTRYPLGVLTVDVEDTRPFEAVPRVDIVFTNQP
ncbi:hypothetical protein PTSG_11301 [Salpingoeca rosetta]|uniref:Uncharacterized protein n=1 Tax=Salpingoeca rosetta (strain ATCC 50818 / BSB-021) TaxID=946362 RepID=F2UT06_SALR5|nr:uncharacterized protein PTSG_11301 [Salpingoeca rosetta]EGD81265.1 hypothetical protein PTSG_11301 [Salpingoeca rosetta]|eukprot:XP_004987661.1 hypothetical protein PTSG_11301 [Salpingoeca rosetta]